MDTQQNTGAVSRLSDARVVEFFSTINERRRDAELRDAIARVVELRDAWRERRAAEARENLV